MNLDRDYIYRQAVDYVRFANSQKRRHLLEYAASVADVPQEASTEAAEAASRLVDLIIAEVQA